MSILDPRAIALSWLLVGSMLVGCSPIPTRQTPPPNLFTLKPAWDASPTQPTIPNGPTRETGDQVPVIVVAPPEARAGFTGPRMAYVKRPFEIKYFARHEWAEPPTRMLAPLLELALERTGRFRPVASGLGVLAPLRIETEIVALQQEFDAGPSQVRFRIRALLLDPIGGRVIATSEFEAVEPAVSEDAYGGVVAANRAVARVLEQLAGWCAEEGIE